MWQVTLQAHRVHKTQHPVPVAAIPAFILTPPFSLSPSRPFLSLVLFYFPSMFSPVKASCVVGTRLLDCWPLSTWPVFLFSICLVGDGVKWAAGGCSAAWPELDHSPVLCPWASHFTVLDLILFNYKWRPDLDDSNIGCSIPLGKAKDFFLFQIGWAWSRISGFKC